MNDTNLENLPLVSIITVIYNGEKIIEETILSIIRQNYPRIEYIMIDGGSTDGTLGIIEKYKDRIAYVISEKDRGIYDAMNKGLAIATGEWTNFMNGGDKYASSTSLKDIFQSNIDFKKYDILYGSTVVEFDGYQILKKPGHLKKLWQGTQFCHQSTFIRTEVNKKNAYNLNNKITADFEFFYISYLNGIKFLRCDQVIAIYKSGGLSDQKNVQVAYSFYKTVISRKKENKVIIFHGTHIISILIKNLIKSIIPFGILRKIRKMRN